MSFMKFQVNNSFSFDFDETELKTNVDKYINHLKLSKWSYHFNRIFISPGNSFNVKYLIKFLSTKLIKRDQDTRTEVSSTTMDSNQLISQMEKSGFAAESRFSDVFNGIRIVRVDDYSVRDELHVNDDILDGLTNEEFFRLLDVEPKRRLETIMSHYHAFNKTLDDIPFDTLDKLNSDVQTEVPYQIYIEATENVSLNVKYEENVKTVSNYNLLDLLRTCGVILIDISRDVTALTKGKEIFRSIKKKISGIKGKDKMIATKNKRLIVVISTVMTWAGSTGRKEKTVSEKDLHNRVPNPEFSEHYQFELEVLALNTTQGFQEIMKTVIIWSGLTYGFEQDLLKFAFDSACKNSDKFLVPKSLNYVPAIHVGNLARIVHNVIIERHKLKNHCIFAVENPMNTLKQIITTLGKTCNSGTLTPVSLDEFMNNYKLEDIHEKIISINIKISSSIYRMWPNFKWYEGVSSLIPKMKSLVETYKRIHKIKIIKLLILGPPASGKTKLACRLAEYYNLIYVEPKQISQICINEKREQLMSLRQTRQYSISKDSLDDIDDDHTDDADEIDPVISQKIVELDKELNKLYASVDSNDGVLEDIYLITLINKKISHSISSKRGYVLDGYPVTVDQANQLFEAMSPYKQINVKKLPDLIVCLKQKIPCNPLSTVRSDDNIDTANLIETTSTKRHLIFSGVVATASSSDSQIVIKTPKLSVKATKSILKKNIKEGARQKPERLFWNEQNHYDLLKMFNRFYVPIKTIDSPYSPLIYDIHKEELPEKDINFEHLLSVVVKEIECDQQNEFPKNMNILSNTNSVAEASNVKHHEHYELRQLGEKMTLLEEFEKATDFEHIGCLSNEEYLMKYCTPTLTKLFVQVAKVRPTNPIDFLAYMSLRENPEGLANNPGYSKEGVKVHKLLERMFHMYGYDENVIDSDTLTELSSVHSIEDKEDKNGETYSALVETISEELQEYYK